MIPLGRSIPGKEKKMAKKFRCINCGKVEESIHTTEHECFIPESFHLDEQRQIHIKDKSGNRVRLSTDEANVLMRELHEFFHGDD